METQSDTYASFLRPHDISMVSENLTIIRHVIPEAVRASAGLLLSVDERAIVVPECQPELIRRILVR
jgi:hypothetical protein